MVVSDEDKILIKRLYLKGYTAKRLADEFPEKSWTKCSVNKLSERCGTQAQLTGGQAAADRAVPALKKMLRQLISIVLSQGDKPQTHRTVREI